MPVEYGCTPEVTYPNCTSSCTLKSYTCASYVGTCMYVHVHVCIHVPPYFSKPSASCMCMWLCWCVSSVYFSFVVSLSFVVSHATHSVVLYACDMVRVSTVHVYNTCECSCHTRLSTCPAPLLCRRLERVRETVPPRSKSDTTERDPLFMETACLYVVSQGIYMYVQPHTTFTGV